MLSGAGPSLKRTPRSNPSRAGTGKPGPARPDPHDSAARSGSRKRQAIEGVQANGDVASQAQHADASTQPRVAAAMDQTGAQSAAAASEDTQSNGDAARGAPANDVQQLDAAGSQSELVKKLAANLQMALKALSVLKGVDSAVFELLSPVELGNLDLHTLCQTPSQTP